MDNAYDNNQVQSWATDQGIAMRCCGAHDHRLNGQVELLPLFLGDLLGALKEALEQEAS